MSRRRRSFSIAVLDRSSPAAARVAATNEVDRVTSEGHLVRHLEIDAEPWLIPLECERPSGSPP